MIPRHLLPQIPNDKVDEFREFVIGNDVKAEMKRVPVSSLKPIQSHVNRDKVEALKKDMEKLVNPLVVTHEGFVLDGHHRWIALKELEPDFQLTCLVISAPLKKVIELGHEFDGSFVRTVYESTTYKQ